MLSHGGDDRGSRRQGPATTGGGVSSVECSAVTIATHMLEVSFSPQTASEAKKATASQFHRVATPDQS